MKRVILLLSLLLLSFQAQAVVANSKKVLDLECKVEALQDPINFSVHRSLLGKYKVKVKYIYEKGFRCQWENANLEDGQKRLFSCRVQHGPDGGESFKIFKDEQSGVYSGEYLVAGPNGAHPYEMSCKEPIQLPSGFSVGNNN